MKNIFIILLTVLFLILRYHTNHYMINYALIAGSFFFTFYCLKTKFLAPIVKYSLFLCITPYIYVQYIHCLLMWIIVGQYELWRTKIDKNHIQIIIYFLFLYGIAVTLIVQFHEPNYLAYPLFMITYFSSFSVLFISTKLSYDEIGEIMEILVNLSIAVLIVGLYQNLILGVLGGDSLTGGTIHSHYLALILSFLFLNFIIEFRKLAISPCALKYYIIIPIAPYLMFISDSKAHIISIFLGLIIYTMAKLWYNSFFIKNIRSVGIFFIITPCLLFLSFLVSKNIYISSGVKKSVYNLVSEHIVSDSRIRTWLLKDWWNLKSETPLLNLFGRGPGTFLSKACNSRAYNLLDKYKFDIAKGNKKQVRSKLPAFIPPFASSDFRRYVYPKIIGMIGDDITWSSSLVAFLWEFGLIGSIILVYLFWSGFKKGIFLSFSEDVLARRVGFFSAVFAVSFIVNAYYRGFLEVPYNTVILYMFWGMSIRLNVLNQWHFYAEK